MSGDKHFNPEKIFFWLFLFTALEVLWGYAFGVWFHPGRVILWGGLIGFALVKAILIAQYFMHFKFEGWIIKALIVPTPFLVAYILVMISPDVSRNDHLIEPIGSMYDQEDGTVKEDMAELSHSIEHASGEGGGH